VAYYYIVGALYFIFGQVSFVPKLLNCIVGSMTVPLAYHVAFGVSADENMALRTARYVAYFPSLILWSALNLRDIWTAFLILLVCRLALRLQESPRVSQLVLLSASIFLLTEFRGYILLPVVVPIALSFVVRGRRHFARNLGIGAIVGAAIIYVDSASAQRRFRLPDLATLQELRYFTSLGAQQFDVAADISTPTNALLFLPKGVAFFLLAPLSMGGPERRAGVDGSGDAVLLFAAPVPLPRPQTSGAPAARGFAHDAVDGCRPHVRLCTRADQRGNGIPPQGPGPPLLSDVRCDRRRTAEDEIASGSQAAGLGPDAIAERMKGRSVLTTSFGRGRSPSGKSTGWCAERMIRALGLLPYPTDRAPGQRYRIEQWAPLLAAEGVQVTFAPFLSPSTMDVLYQRGHTLRKFGEAVLGYWRRARRLAGPLPFDVAYVYREMGPFGTAWLESWLRRRMPFVFDFDDAIYLRSVSEANSRVAWLKSQRKTASICRIATAVTVGNENLAHTPGATRPPLR
jgi:hypothetical protein